MKKNTVINLTKDLEKKYTDFIFSFEKISIFHSLKYRDLISQCTDSVPYYLVSADSEGKIDGIMPAFIKEGQHGRVINSLPFFGSHGGVVAENADAAYSLLTAIQESAIEKNCVSLTINTNLYDNYVELYDLVIKPTGIINKIGQIKILPENIDDVDKALMSGFHQKTRNIIRKSLTYNIRISIQNNEKGFLALEKYHVENMRAKNILPKPGIFFMHIINCWIPEKDYNVYVAEYNGEIISALLVLYHNKTVEYFCPATNVAYRSMNPLSVLIFVAMHDSVAGGYKYWNWGGSSIMQKSVYDFKKKWTTLDVPYYTMNKIYIPNISLEEKRQVSDCYPYFFVIPF